MARKPNYAFERNTRAKAKAEKREAKRQAKLALKAESQPTEPESADDAAGAGDVSPTDTAADDDGSPADTA